MAIFILFVHDKSLFETCGLYLNELLVVLFVYEKVVNYLRFFESRGDFLKGNVALLFTDLLILFAQVLAHPALFHLAFALELKAWNLVAFGAVVRISGYHEED